MNFFFTVGRWIWLFGKKGWNNTYMYWTHNTTERITTLTFSYTTVPKNELKWMVRLNTQTYDASDFVKIGKTVSKNTNGSNYINGFKFHVDNPISRTVTLTIGYSDKGCSGQLYLNNAEVYYINSPSRIGMNCGIAESVEVQLLQGENIIEFYSETDYKCIEWIVITEEEDVRNFFRNILR